MTAYQLVRFDPPGVQNLIFQTPKLKEIQAASARLENAMRQDLKALEKRYHAKPMYLAGGGGTYFVAADEAGAFRKDLKCALAKKLPGMPFVVGPERPILFSDTVGKTLERAEQLSWPQLPELASAPVFGPALIGCASCKFVPAAVQIKDDRGSYFLCAQCQAKRGEKFTNAFHEALITLAPKRGWRLNQNDFAQDLIQISEESHTRKGYLAVIHFDGNGMGEYFKQEREKIGGLEGLSNFEHMSDSLRRSMAEVFAEAVVTTWPNGFSKKVPADMLYLGGDDAVMICAPDRALKLAVNASHLFGKRFEAKKFSLAIGVAIARHNTPMNTLLELAMALNDSAKRLHYDHGGTTLDFQVLLGQSMAELDQFRQDVYHPKDASTTARPYKLDELPKLHDEARRLAKLAGRLWDLVEASKSKAEGELAAIQLLGRMNEHEAQPLRQHFEQSKLGRALELPPWFQPEGHRIKPYTVLRDILELLPFLEVDHDSHGT